MKQSIYFQLILFFLVGICCACKSKPASTPPLVNEAAVQKNAVISLAENSPKDVVDPDTIQCEGEKCDNGADECKHLLVASSGPEFRICLFEQRNDGEIREGYLSLSRLDKPSMKYEDISLGFIENDDIDSYYITGIDITDLNSDGKNEFMVGYFRSGRYEETFYSAWLWNDENQNFVDIPRFGDIRNPTFPDDQTIVSSGRSNYCVTEIVTYRWIDGKLVKVESHDECEDDEVCQIECGRHEDASEEED